MSGEETRGWGEGELRGRGGVSERREDEAAVGEDGRGEAWPPPARTVVEGADLAAPHHLPILSPLADAASPSPHPLAARRRFVRRDEDDKKNPAPTSGGMHVSLSAILAEELSSCPAPPLPHPLPCPPPSALVCPSR
uniref:Uncharacterized protein n=1 Tax=Oryza glumipatula TaxID=40148 RepID=A0A0D9ZLN5_9ORYZ